MNLLLMAIPWKRRCCDNLTEPCDLPSLTYVPPTLTHTTRSHNLLTPPPPHTARSFLERFPCPSNSLFVGSRVRWRQTCTLRRGREGRSGAGRGGVDGQASRQALQHLDLS